MLLNALKRALFGLLLAIQVASYGSYTILVHLCEDNGRIQFNSTSMNLLIELVKLKISLIAFAVRKYANRRQRRSNRKYSSANLNIENNDDNDIERNSPFDSISHKLKPSNFLRASLDFSTPAFLYFVNNNLAVYIQLYMDSTSYQMLSNLKILTTACLYYLFFGSSKLTKTKAFSLLLLFVAGLIYSVANLNSLAAYYLDESDIKSMFSSSFDLSELQEPSPNEKNVKFRLRNQIYITEVGFGMMCIYCILSGLSGVYNEYLLKRGYSECIYLQNTYLYFYGSIFNLIAYFFETSYSSTIDGSIFNSFDQFFKGFSIYTWALVATQVLNGILMSIVMKHSSNITRLFVISCSLIVTTVLSILVFSLKLNGYFYFCFSLIMISLFLYVR